MADVGGPATETCPRTGQSIGMVFQQFGRPRRPETAALAMDPKLMLFDEPRSALDPVGRELLDVM